MKYVKRDFRGNFPSKSIRCDLFNGLKPYYPLSKSGIKFSDFYICKKSGKDRSFYRIGTDLNFIYRTKWEF